MGEGGKAWLTLKLHIQWTEYGFLLRLFYLFFNHNWISVFVLHETDVQGRATGCRPGYNGLGVGERREQ